MLQIEIDNGSGFCFGVTTAIKKAEEELAKGTKLYCLGDIVHNSMEVERLTKKGLITINHDQLRELHDVKVLLRAHGEPPETYELARRNNIEIIDATCPVVLALQRRIKSQYEKGHQVADISLENKGEPVVVLPTRSQTKNKCDEICSSSPVSTPLSPREETKSTGSIVIFGKNGHAEVLGLVGQTHSHAIVIEKFEDVKALDFEHDIYLYSPNSYQVESADEIDMKWFDGVQTVGICGATSTPKWLMEECRDEILRHTK